MSDKVDDDANEESNELFCYFDSEEGSSSQLLQNSPTLPYPRSCSFYALKTGYFLSRWETCENHKELDLSSENTSGTNEKDNKKQRFLQRYSANLPFGHERQTRKNEFVFKHHDRGDLYIEQYRYNHTIGGTGRSWHNAQIAQTLISYVRNGKLKFPIIR